MTGSKTLTEKFGLNEQKGFYKLMYVPSIAYLKKPSPQSQNGHLKNGVIAGGVVNKR